MIGHLIVSGLNHWVHQSSSQNTFTDEQIKIIRENYPESGNISLDELIKLIGGNFEKVVTPGSKLYEDLKGNTCATRLSYAMNKAGFKVSGKNTYQGNGMRVFISADFMAREYLIPNFIRPNVCGGPKLNYPIETKGGGFSIATSIIAQYDISKGRYTHVDVAYKGSIGTNLYRSSSNLNFYGL